MARILRGYFNLRVLYSRTFDYLLGHMDSTSESVVRMCASAHSLTGDQTRTLMELCNKQESSIQDSLSEEYRDHLVSITCAWQQRVYSAAHDGFYCGFIAGYHIPESLFQVTNAANQAKQQTMEYFT